ncbi:MAG: hypothetical protein LBF24_01580 [Puniceicoccales bacterium]|nr:hypothetical protein [Puniceicoccales bacterium]
MVSNYDRKIFIADVVGRIFSSKSSTDLIINGSNIIRSFSEEPPSPAQKGIIGEPSQCGLCLGFELFNDAIDGASSTIFNGFQ